MTPVRHIPTGTIHLVNSMEGYGLPDWETLPLMPSGEAVRWQWSGTDWEENTESALERLRAHRDHLLDQTDKYMVPDRPIQQTQRDQWITYRQALRDLPENVTNPFDFQWPPAPE